VSLLHAQGTFDEQQLPKAEQLSATLRRMWMLIHGETRLIVGASVFMVSAASVSSDRAVLTSSHSMRCGPRLDTER
jgi:hypothetical protein